MSDWKIRKRRNACVRCDREFEEEEVFYSVLLLDGASLGREDRCAECFDAREAEGDAPRTIYWRTRRPPEGKRRVSVDFDVVEQVFFALADHEEERILELRYLMSLLLLRKKRLKLARVKRDEDGEAMVLRRPRRTEAIEVRVFDLSEERSQVLRLELTRIFEGADVEDLLSGPAPVPDPTDQPPGEDEGEDEEGEGVESHAPEEEPAG